MTRIRPAVTNDAEHLFEVHVRAVAQGGVDHYPEEILNLWHSGRTASGMAEVIRAGGCYVLQRDALVLGFVHLRDPELVGLFVDPDFQRLGFGSQLFHFAVREIQGRPMILDSTMNAIEFYVRQGCVRGPMGCVRRNERDLYVRRMEFR